MHGKADIVEEIVRIVGVDRVPLTPFERGDSGAQAGADHDPEAHPQGQARARRARPGRSGHLVVHFASRRRNCSAAAIRRWRWPTRSRPNSPTCGRASFPALSPPRRRMPTAASPMSRCSRSARFSRATSRKTSSPPRPACAAARESQSAAGTGRTRRKMSTPSTPRPMRWRCSRRRARCRSRCRSCRAGRPGCIRAARARSRSGRRTCSAISANCIPRR